MFGLGQGECTGVCVGIGALVVLSHPSPMKPLTAVHGLLNYIPPIQLILLFKNINSISKGSNEYIGALVHLYEVSFLKACSLSGSRSLLITRSFSVFTIG